jgi:hypothetical protein
MVSELSTCQAEHVPRWNGPHSIAWRRTWRAMPKNNNSSLKSRFYISTISVRVKVKPWQLSSTKWGRWGCQRQRAGLKRKLAPILVALSYL